MPFSTCPSMKHNYVSREEKHNKGEDPHLPVYESLDSWLTFTCIMFLLACLELRGFSVGIPELEFAINRLDMCCCCVFLSGHRRTNTCDLYIHAEGDLLITYARAIVLPFLLSF